MLRVRFLLIALIALAALVGTPPAGRASLDLPTVTTDLVDAEGTSVAGSAVAAGAQVRAVATVAGAAGAPSGPVTFAQYDGSDCGGASTDAWTAALTTALEPQSHTTDRSNAGGWDSATAWNANGVDQFQTNWFGGLFAGTDNAFFSSSSMAWRFTGLPVPADATVTRAYLSLRIRKSRPSIPAEGVWTWKTVLATDTRSGADFAGENRWAFLARFNVLGARWEMPLSSAVLDPFGTNDGAAYARSPDVASLIVSRIDDPGWSAGGDVVVGIINNGTVGIAEAEVVDQADYVRCTSSGRRRKRWGRPSRQPRRRRPACTRTARTTAATVRTPPPTARA